ncbi:MAG: hypothetical protein FVQ83_15410 [Chloroflexi bacterium]|nr:hypothetical protein [Chloroflexota bacterium]
MSSKNIKLVLVAASVLVLAQLACTIFGYGLAPTGEEIGEQPAAKETEGAPLEEAEQQPAQAQEQPPLPAGPPTPTPLVYQGTPPKAGTGGVYGRLLWNGQPAVGIDVKLCDEIKFFGGCQGAEYPTLTDSNGIYLFLDIPPGTYGLAFHALDQDTWLFISSFVLNAKDFEIPADEVINVGDFHTLKLDLKLISPSEDQVISSANPTLSWEPYPDATYYEVSFHSDLAGVIIGSRIVTETSLMIETALQLCEYSWKIEAYNAQGILIAENDGWSRFKVTDQPHSCYLVLLSPLDGSSVPGSNITLTWQVHGLATSYKIHMYNKDDRGDKVLDFVQTSDTSFSLTQTLSSGVYNWVVYAYDQFGESLGFSDTFTLTVTSP